jgi:hypothetical protein
MERVLYVLILVVILGTGAALADLPGLEAFPMTSPSQAQDSTHGWRRTSNGWEHNSLWRRTSPATPWVVKNVNPISLALLQIMVP